MSDPAVQPLPPEPAGDSAPGAWERALWYAGEAPDLPDALFGILAEAVATTSADAGAVLDLADHRCRGWWGCEPAEVQRLLRDEGEVARAVERVETAPEEWVLLSGTEARTASGAANRHLLIMGLRVRGAPCGTLALLYRRDEAPTLADRGRAASFARLIGLAVEHDRLYEAAREADQARRHFLTALNHELRTPATAFLMEAELLHLTVTEGLPPRLDTAVRSMETQVQEIARVLKRVLDLGQLEEGIAPERPDVVHPRQAVVELLRRVEPAAKRKQLKLTVYVPRALPPLQTDSARFARILLQLFSNAVKYTDEGGIEVRIERRTRAAGRTRSEPVLVVRVQDTGAGVPHDLLEHVLEPFTQVDEGARTDSASRGVGLGLPLARKLAESLGGTLTLENAPGGGTVAVLTLPYEQPAIP